MQEEKNFTEGSKGNEGKSQKRRRFWPDLNLNSKQPLGAAVFGGASLSFVSFASFC